MELAIRLSVAGVHKPLGREESGLRTSSTSYSPTLSRLSYCDIHCTFLFPSHDPPPPPPHHPASIHVLLLLSRACEGGVESGERPERVVSHSVVLILPGAFENRPCIPGGTLPSPSWRSRSQRHLALPPLQLPEACWRRHLPLPLPRTLRSIPRAAPSSGPRASPPLPAHPQPRRRPRKRLVWRTCHRQCPRDRASLTTSTCATIPSRRASIPHEPIPSLAPSSQNSSCSLRTRPMDAMSASREEIGGQYRCRRL